MLGGKSKYPASNFSDSYDDGYKEHQNYVDSAFGGKEHDDNVGDEHHHTNDERFVCNDQDKI